MDKQYGATDDAAAAAPRVEEPQNANRARKAIAAIALTSTFMWAATATTTGKREMTRFTRMVTGNQPVTMRVNRVTSRLPVVVAVAAHIIVDVRAMAAMAFLARLAFCGSSTRGTGALASSVAPYCLSMVSCFWGAAEEAACLVVEARGHGTACWSFVLLCCSRAADWGSRACLAGPGLSRERRERIQ